MKKQTKLEYVSPTQKEIELMTTAFLEDLRDSQLKDLDKVTFENGEPEIINDYSSDWNN